MRADLWLVAHQLVPSRQRAKRLIEEGAVLRRGVPVAKPAEEIEGDDVTGVEIRETLPYVGRGGLKLEAALTAFGIDPTGLSALDVGASTGGFTDCLLRFGAARVCAVDSGEGQLAPQLRADPRVRSLERCNARYLTAETIGERVALIVMDVSFISATYLIPRFPEWLLPGGNAVCLVKPQFEVGRALVGKGGVVRDPAAHRAAVERVMEAGRAAGLHPVGLIASPIAGGDGNREFLLWLRETDDLREVDPAAVRAVTENRKGER